MCGGCGRETTAIGYEESEQLDVQPAKYFVVVTKREKRACKRVCFTWTKNRHIGPKTCRRLAIPISE